MAQERKADQVLLDDQATGAPTQASRADRRHLGLQLVWVAIVAFLVLGGFEAWHDSPTFDEPVYVSAGLVAILHHDVADNAEHPPLFKVLAALPVLAVGPVIPHANWTINNEHRYGARFVEA